MFPPHRLRLTNLNASRDTAHGLTRLRLAILLLLAMASPCLAAGTSIGILASPALFANPAVDLAVKDSISLLKRGFPGSAVSLNSEASRVLLILSPPAAGSLPTRAGARRGYQTTSVPDAGFRWDSSAAGGAVVLRLRAATPEGIAAGLYALLQEKLGFRFLHPRQSVYPSHRVWPLPAAFTFSGTPRFASRGFHLHTLHPTELTEQLHDPGYPNALADVKDYLDWLARNGQNSFQFFLLRGVDRKLWIPHARTIVRYAQSRGIKCGVELSLAMLQQQAFQAIALTMPFPSYRQQVDATLSWLFQAPWDFVTLDTTMGEYLPALGALLPELQSHFEVQVAKRYGARFFLATHVIRRGPGSGVPGPRLPASGILIHSVMCYSASEEKAPVYGNLNQRFLLEAARKENRRRETWYWPESSYWVCFDSSVPLLLLTYLDSRYQDLEQMAGIGVSGHLTFSSGWEWGYWLTDWSIARWSWDYSEAGRTTETSPLSRLGELFPDPELLRDFRDALALQKFWLKDQELQRYLSALTPFAELPPPLAHSFQPSPDFSYSWLRYSASRKEAAAVLEGAVPELEQYARLMELTCDHLEARCTQLRKKPGMSGAPWTLLEELEAGLRVGALRARHRALTLRALIAGREGPALAFGTGRESERLLARAREVRAAAQALVTQQEGRYRFPAASLARHRKSISAYQFGYLYPASSLFFWRREEEQVRQGRFDPFFMNLWDPWSVLGLETLSPGV
jgi:hypothetical protein